MHKLSLDIDDLIRRYRAGETPQEISATVNVSAETIRRRLRERGELLPRAEATRRRYERPEAVAQARAAQKLGVAAVRRDDLPVGDIAADYRNGDSIAILAQRYGCSGPTIVRILNEQGAPRRGRADAQRQRTITDEAERTRRLKIAASQLGIPMSEAALDARARGKALSQAHIGEGEERLVAWLRERGLAPRQQVACHRYNIDIAVGRLAVEVQTGSHYPLGRSHIARRIEHLTSCGWSVLYVWVTGSAPLTEGAADQVVALLDQLGRNPSASGQHRVIRGNGETAVLWGGSATPTGRPRTERYEVFIRKPGYRMRYI